MSNIGPENLNDAFDDPLAEAIDHVARRAVFLAAALRNILQLAVFNLTPDQRMHLREHGDQIIYVGRNDFAFTVHLRNSPPPLRVVVLQPALLQCGRDASPIIGGALLRQIVERTDSQEACAVATSGIEAGRYLSAEHQPLVAMLFQRMPEMAKVWLTGRGRGVVIVADSTSEILAVPVTDNTPQCDLVILNSKALNLPQEQVLGILAHELGHLAHRDQKGSPTPHTTEGEIEADRYAVAWGFRDGLREHLEDEISTTSDSALRQQFTARVRALL
jgi:hypothetical protein